MIECWENSRVVQSLYFAIPFRHLCTFLQTIIFSRNLDFSSHLAPKRTGRWFGRVWDSPTKMIQFSSWTRKEMISLSLLKHMKRMKELCGSLVGLGIRCSTSFARLIFSHKAVLFNCKVLSKAYQYIHRKNCASFFNICWHNSSYPMAFGINIRAGSGAACQVRMSAVNSEGDV